MSPGERALAWITLAVFRSRKGGVRWGRELDEIHELPEPERAARLAGLRARSPGGGGRAEAARVLSRCEAAGIQVVHPEHPAYPDALRRHSGAPLVLYLRGDPSGLAARCLGVAGSRRIRARPRLLARSLGALCRRLGLTLVAGWSSAAERAAVQGNLGAEGAGRIQLIMPYGLDRDHPADSARGRRQVLASGGAAWSLLPPGESYRKGVWDARNRLLALLSDDLVLVEAGERSGSLKVARAAADLGGEVWVPRDEDESPLGAGTRRLAEEGASVFCHPLELVWPELGELPQLPRAVRVLERSGALGPDALLVAAELPGFREVEALLERGWLDWTADGRLVPDYLPALQELKKNEKKSPAPRAETRK